jgi:hypothetical protein
MRKMEKNQYSRSTMTFCFRSLDSFLGNLDAAFIEEPLPAVLDIAAFAAVARAVDFDFDGADFAEGVAEALECGVGWDVGVCWGERGRVSLNLSFVCLFVGFAHSWNRLRTVDVHLSVSSSGDLLQTNEAKRRARKQLPKKRKQEKHSLVSIPTNLNPLSVHPFPFPVFTPRTSSSHLYPLSLYRGRAHHASQTQMPSIKMRNCSLE